LLIQMKRLPILNMTPVQKFLHPSKGIITFTGTRSVTRDPQTIVLSTTKNVERIPRNQEGRKWSMLSQFDLRWT